MKRNQLIRSYTHRDLRSNYLISINYFNGPILHRERSFKVSKFIYFSQTIRYTEKQHNIYRQFGGHKNRENKSLKIEFNFLLVCYGLLLVFIHVRLTIQRNRIFAPLDKKLFIYLMQNFRYLPI